MRAFHSGLVMTVDDTAVVRRLRECLDECFPPAMEGYIGAVPGWLPGDCFARCKTFNRTLAEAAWLVPH